MEDVYGYIEAYFSQALSSGERTAFEARCINDKAFAEEVAFYVASRQAIRQQLLQQKRQLWATAAVAPAHTLQPAPVKTLLRRLLPYVAAACTILVVALYVMLKSPSPGSLANNYVQQHYTQIGVNMGTGQDTALQAAIEAYNSKQYTKALKLFGLLELKNPGNADEKKYTGLVYLLSQDYDKALEKFNELANMQGLFSNPGNFLKAITLMERSAPGDEQKARQLLQQVVKENAEGADTAKQWLKKL